MCGAYAFLFAHAYFNIIIISDMFGSIVFPHFQCEHHSEEATAASEAHGGPLPVELIIGLVIFAGIMFGFIVESIAHATTDSHGHGHCDKDSKGWLCSRALGETVYEGDVLRKLIETLF